MRNFIVTLFMSLFLACSCAHIESNDGADVRFANESIVSVDQHVRGDKITPNPDGGINIEPDAGSGGAIGTGVIIDVIGGESLVATVGHVAHKKDPLEGQEDTPSLLRVTSSVLTIRTLAGQVCPAEEIFFSEKEDLSILRVKCIAGTPMPLADALPPMGSEVLVSGAALGLHPDGIFIPVDGRYVGNIKERGLGYAVTNPVAAGHSGSPVIHNGKIIGILKSHRLDWEHLSFFVPLDILNSGITAARKTWNAH